MKKPPQPTEDDEPQPERTVEVGADRVRVSYGMKYGLDNYGSFEFGVSVESSTRPADGGSIRATIKRVEGIAADAFNERDTEVRRALGMRLQGEPAPANLNKGAKRHG